MPQSNFTRTNVFIKGPNLCVIFKEAGLGNSELITNVLSAKATAEYACVNRGGQFPLASYKKTVSGPVSTTATFESGQNGQVTATLCISPPTPGNISCPTGQQLVLVSVTYNTVTLSSTTNHVSMGITGTLAETFVNLMSSGGWESKCFQCNSINNSCTIIEDNIPHDYSENYRGYVKIKRKIPNSF